MGLAGINYIYSGILELETGDMPLYLDFNTESGNKYNSVNFAKFYKDEEKRVLSTNTASITGYSLFDVNRFTGGGKSGDFSYGILKLNAEDLFSEDLTFLV